MSLLFNRLNKNAQNKRPVRKLMKKVYRKRPWNRAVTFIAATLVFITTYMLILPAITMTKPVLDCPYVSDMESIILHQHDAACYNDDGVLVCTLPERKLHVHDESCYENVVIGYETIPLVQAIAEGRLYNAETMTASAQEEVLFSDNADAGTLEPIAVQTIDEGGISDISGAVVGEEPLQASDNLFGDQLFTDGESSDNSDITIGIGDTVQTEDAAAATADTLGIDELRGIDNNQNDFNMQAAASTQMVTVPVIEHRLTCGREELNPELHVHDDSCYETVIMQNEDGSVTEGRVLICTKPTAFFHQHGEECFKKAGSDDIIVYDEQPQDSQAFLPQDDGQAIVIYDEPQTDDNAADYVDYAEDNSKSVDDSLIAEIPQDTVFQEGDGILADAHTDESIIEYFEPSPIIVEEQSDREDSNSAVQTEESTIEIDKNSMVLEDTPIVTENVSVVIEDAPLVTESKEEENQADNAPVINEEESREEVSEVPSEITTEIQTEAVTELTTEDTVKGANEDDVIVTEIAAEDVSVVITEADDETATKVKNAAIPEVTTEIATENITENTAEITTEVTTEATAEVATEATVKLITKITAEATTETTSEVVPENGDGILTEITTEPAKELVSEIDEISTEAVSESAYEINTQITTAAVSEFAAEAVSESVSEVGNESVKDVVKESVTEPVSESAAEDISESSTENEYESVSEFSAEMTTETVSEPVSEAPSEITTEALNEVFSEAAIETTTESSGEVFSEAFAETTTEAAAQVSSEASTETTTELFSEASSEAFTEVTTAVLTFDGADYHVYLTYDNNSGVTEDARLSVVEIDPESKEYELYLSQAKAALGLDEDAVLPKEYARFFDITILDEEGNEIQPKNQVKVEIIYDQPVADVKDENVNASVLHFDEEKNAEVLSTLETGAEEGVEVSMEGTGEDSDGADTNELDESVPESSSETTESEAAADPFQMSMDDSKGAPSDVEQSLDTESAAADAVVSSDYSSFEADSDGMTDQIEAADKGVAFATDSFSVFGIIYTVDLHYEINGKIYEFCIPGGGFVSLEHVVEMLGIASIDENTGKGPENAENKIENENEFEGKVPGVDVSGENSTAYEEAIKLNEVEVSETTKKFVAEVESLEFSNPELLWAGKVDEAATVGDLKEANGLEVEYSVDLTEEQISDINEQKVKARDWALISIQPFTSEETLTVTMKNGEIFTIRVTDYQISTNVLTADGKHYKITVTFGDDAEIPAGTTLVAEEIIPGTDDYLQHLGETWAEVNKEYLKQEEEKKDNNGGLDEYEDIRPVNLDDARFFNVRLVYNEEEIEPKAPVQVDIQYVDGLETNVSASETVLGAAHFIDDTVNDDSVNDDTDNKDAEYGEVELIQAVDTVCDEDGKYVGFSYNQESFSDIGTYVGQETTDDTNASVADRIAYPKLSAMLRASSGSLKDELGEPVASKALEDNEDGTYTLKLSVTGAAKKKDEQPKANVLFVMDRSSSMSNSGNDIYLPYTGEYQNGTTYYGTSNGTNYYTLNFSNGQYTYNDVMWPYTTHTYTGTVYTRISRLKAEQDAMSILFKDLLENNKDENDNYTKDTVEISVISFADDRGKMSEGTEYPSGGSVNGWTYSDYTGLMTVVNNTNTPSGTNWEDALMYAKDVADAKKSAQPDEPVFVIFLTDGEPTAVHNEHGGAHHYIGDYGDVHGDGFIAAYKPSRDDAKAIVDEGYGFYGIFTFNPGEEQTRYLKRLVHYAYTGYDVSDTTEGDFSYLDTSQYVGSNFFNADSPENLASAFDDILATITTMIAHGNISIVDGLTTDAMTSTLVAGKADGFTYKVADEHGNTLYTVEATGNTSNPSVTFKIGNTTYSGDQVEVKTAGNGKKYYSVMANGKEYKMALADFVNTGEGNDEIKELTWDLSAIGTLENQYTYSLETVVWPNQEAYDYVAALNNGLMDWNEATQIPVYEDETETKVKYYKNGVKDYPSIVWDPNKRVYSVLTNTKQELEYSIISTTNGVETIEGPYTVDLDTPDPMDLKATSSALEKVWNINRDPSILYKYLYESKDDQGNPKAFNIGFDINQDGELYKEIDLPGKATVTAEGVTYDWSAYDNNDLATYNDKQFSKRWSQDFSISTGLMLSEAQMDARSLDKSLYNDKKYYFNNTWYYVLEPGHDFKISEPAVGYEFDFEEPTYHPMLVDGVLTDVKFTTEGTTKSISSMESLEIDTPTGKSALTVFNTLRGYINVRKKVVDYDGTTELTTDNTEFTFEVELTNAMPVFEGDHIPWYGVNGLYYHDVEADDNYYQAEYINGTLQVKTEEGGPYTGIGNTFNPDYAGEQTIKYLVDGQEVSVTICGNQMTPDDGNETDGYKKVTGTTRITQAETLYIANVPVNTHYTIKETGLASLGYQLIDIERQVGTNASATVPVSIDAQINGEIVQNTETLITYTNKCQVTDIHIQKVDEKGKGLEGAVFQLKKVKGIEVIDASTIESVSGLGKVTKEIDGKNVEYTSAFETTGDVQTIRGLPDGTYRLVEVYVPTGYITTVKYIQFDIENRVMKNVTTGAEDTSTIDFTAAGTNSLAILKIKNTPGAALPNTGGPGTQIFTILGSILILAAGVLLWGRRRLVLHRI